MDMKKGVVSAEEDLELEGMLGKKLKVIDGKLRGVDDGINMLSDGISSSLDSVEDNDNEIQDDDENYENVKSSKRGSANDNEKGHQRSALDVPHQRSVTTNESDEYTQFRRSAIGLLNRLCESNLESITREASTIVRMATHIDASQIISQLILITCSRLRHGHEHFASVFAAFVAGIAHSVGKDFSAKFLESFAKVFEDEYQKGDNSSLWYRTLLLSYLCIFGVCASDLIYDLLILLAKRLTEVDVYIIWTILQRCGMKLSSDDPAAFEDFILSFQSRVNELKSSSMVGGQPKIHNKDMEFMLQDICDFKNKKNKSKEDSASHVFVKELQKLKVENFSLRGLKWSRLIDPSKKGQWWLSGKIISSGDNVEEVANIIDKEVLETQKFMQLAAAQRMNTDARRAIFSGFPLFAANDAGVGLPASTICAMCLD